MLVLQSHSTKKLTLLLQKNVDLNVTVDSVCLQNNKHVIHHHTKFRVGGKYSGHENSQRIQNR